MIEDTKPKSAPPVIGVDMGAKEGDHTVIRLPMTHREYYQWLRSRLDDVDELLRPRDKAMDALSVSQKQTLERLEWVPFYFNLTLCWQNQLHDVLLKLKMPAMSQLRLQFPQEDPVLDLPADMEVILSVEGKVVDVRLPMSTLRRHGEFLWFMTEARRHTLTKILGQ